MRGTKRIGIAICLVICSICACVLGGCLPSSQGVDVQPTRTDGVNKSYVVSEEDVVVDESTGNAFVRGIVLIYFEPGTSQQARQDVVDSVGGEIVGRMDVFDELQVRIDAEDEAQLTEAVQNIEARDGVDFATLDYVEFVPLQYVPDDPWGSWGFGMNDNSWWAIAIDAPSAWELCADLDLADVAVAVVDNGFDFGHEDLASRLVHASEADAANRNARDHGTHVAGIIGAEAGNGKGLAGVYPGGRVLCYDGSSGTNEERADFYSGSSVEVALYETVRAGAKVVNFSLGSSGGRSEQEWAASRSVIDASGRAYSRRMGALLAAGYDFVVVQSAGNGDSSHRGVDASYNLDFCAVNEYNCDTSYVAAPEILDRIIVVAAVERAGDGYRLTSFSNGGPSVDVCAPGRDVYSTVVGGYATKSGTSMACPIVSGVAALAWAVNPDLNGREVKQLVCQCTNTWASGNDEGLYAPMSYPMVDAGLVVREARPQASGLSPEDAAALEYFELYLRDICDHGYFQDDTVVLPADGSEQWVYRYFAIGDFDGDNALELFCEHESMSLETGISYGCVCDVIEYIPSPRGISIAYSASDWQVPTDPRFFGTGYIRLYGDESSGYLYMPVSAEHASALGLANPSDTLSLRYLDGAWHRGVVNHGGYIDEELDTAQYGWLVTLLEGDGGTVAQLRPMTAEEIDAVSPDAGGTW